MLPPHFVRLKPKFLPYTASSQKLEVRTAWERGYSYPSHLLKPTSTHTFHNLTPPPLTAFTISHLLQPTSTHTLIHTHNIAAWENRDSLSGTAPCVSTFCTWHHRTWSNLPGLSPLCTAGNQRWEWPGNSLLVSLTSLQLTPLTSFTISHLSQSTFAHTPSFMLTIPQPSRIEDQFLGENVSLLIWTSLVPSHLSSQLGMEPEAPHLLILLEPHQQQLAPTNRTCLMLTCHQHQLSTSLHLPTRDTTHLVYILCSVILLLLLFLFSLLLLL